MLQIRKIKPEDVQFVLNAAKENNFPQGKLLSNIEGFLICENADKRCGCGCMTLCGDKGCLSWVMVSEDSRRQKLGGAITKALLNIADINGIKDVCAAALPTYECREFMQAMGFEEADGKGLKDDMKEILGLEDMEIWHVSLKGYFRSCSGK